MKMPYGACCSCWARRKGVLVRRRQEQNLEAGSERRPWRISRRCSGRAICDRPRTPQPLGCALGCFRFVFRTEWGAGRGCAEWSFFCFTQVATFLIVVQDFAVLACCRYCCVYRSRCDTFGARCYWSMPGQRKSVCKARRCLCGGFRADRAGCQGRPAVGEQERRPEVDVFFVYAGVVRVAPGALSSSVCACPVLNTAQCRRCGVSWVLRFAPAPGFSQQHCVLDSPSPSNPPPPRDCPVRCRSGYT